MVSSLPTKKLIHGSTFSKHMVNFKSLKFDSTIFKQLCKLANPVDAAYVIIPLLLAKPVLHFFEKAIMHDKHGEKFKTSLMGYLEKPVVYLTQFPLFLFVLDVMTILIHSIGIDFHIKGGLPDLIAQISYCLLGGVFSTRIKDWFIQQVLRKRFIATHSKRDYVREATIDELSSVLIWVLMGLLGLEFMSIRTGIALGSIFAVGGIGSASLVLALRGTMENAIGGLLLKLQDKFRVGETITIPHSIEECTVEEINYISTKLRKNDNSLLVVPNHMFSKGEIVNWSRTPYRLFKLSVVWSVTTLEILTKMINKIKQKILDMSEVEKEERSVLVAATGFKENKVIIEVEVHIRATDEVKCAEIKTDVVNIVNSCLTDPH